MGKLKIALVNSHIEIFRAEPHGLLMIGAVLENAGHHVVLYDRLFNDIDIDEIADNDYDLICFSVMTLTYFSAKKNIQQIRARSNKNLIIVGGIHPSIFPKESLQDLGADFAVIGEGEKTIIELVDVIFRDKKELVRVNGIAYFDNHRYIQTQKRNIEKCLDNFPVPARHLLDMEKYLVPPGFIRGLFNYRIATVMTSRGCPFHCSFCPGGNSRYRQRSVEHVIKEIKILKQEYQIEGIHFIDENFCLDKNWLYSFCFEIHKENIKWSFESRVSQLNDTIIKKIKKAGCVQVDLGLESGSDKILRKIKKGITTKEILEGCNLLRKNNMRFTTNMLVGCPDETIVDLKKSYNLLRKIKPSFGVANFLTVLPGTSLYDEYYGKKMDMRLFDIKKDLSSNYYIISNISAVNDKDLIYYHAKIRNYFFGRALVGFFNRRYFLTLLKIINYFCLNLELFIKSLFIVLIVRRERAVYKIVFDVFYEMQKQYYYKKTRKVSS